MVAKNPRFTTPVQGRKVNLQRSVRASLVLPRHSPYTRLEVRRASPGPGSSSPLSLGHLCGTLWSGSRALYSVSGFVGILRHCRLTRLRWFCRGHIRNTRRSWVQIPSPAQVFQEFVRRQPSADFKETNQETIAVRKIILKELSGIATGLSMLPIWVPAKRMPRSGQFESCTKLAGEG